jgi:hypothetical protein
MTGPRPLRAGWASVATILTVGWSRDVRVARVIVDGARPTTLVRQILAHGRS